MLSDYASGLLIGTFTSTNLYLALCYTPPVPTDSGSTIDEVTGGGYSRVTLSSANWINGTGGSKIYNSGFVLTPSADWGLVTSYAICDTLTAGNMLDFGYLTSSISVVSGSKVKVQAGSIIFGVK